LNEERTGKDKFLCITINKVLFIKRYPSIRGEKTPCRCGQIQRFNKTINTIEGNIKLCGTTNSARRKMTRKRFSNRSE